MAVYRVKAKDKMDKVLTKILERLEKLEVKIQLLLLDRGFYSVKCIQSLICRRCPFIMPAIKRGKKETPTQKATGTQALALIKKSCWKEYTIKNPKDGEVSFDLAIVCRNLKGYRQKTGRATLLYATWGVKHKPLRWIKETYRKRFGIESSYRQINQAKIRTCVRNPALRYLFTTLALLLRNIWVWLHFEVISLPHKGGRVLRPEVLIFQRLLLWLILEIEKQYQIREEIFIVREVVIAQHCSDL